MALVVALMALSAVAFLGFAFMDGRGLPAIAGRPTAVSTTKRRTDARPSLMPRTIRQTPID